MAYVKTVWEDNKTPLDAANLNKIEEGIENAVSLSETNEKDIRTLDGKVAAIEVGKQDNLTAGAGIAITDNTVKVDTDHVPYSAGTMAGAKASPGVIYNAAASEQVKPDWQSISLGKGLLGRSIAVYNAATPAQMGLAGTLDVSTPIADTHATTKKYVDKYLPTVDSWVAGGTIPGAHTISLGNVTYSEKIPKLLVLDLNLNRSNSTGGTCALLEQHWKLMTQPILNRKQRNNYLMRAPKEQKARLQLLEKLYWSMMIPTAIFSGKIYMLCMIIMSEIIMLNTFLKPLRIRRLIMAK